MMGYEFATYVNKYLESQGVPTRSIAKIDSNPEKSKHLETATTKLFDQEVDFCNLRTEIYEGDSRIPSQVTFGTPSEDAYRRDITINSLFYNVNTHSVEDFTNKGIPDLIKGYIRTPLAPFETFRDDPLRVIRCIRFASRFNFKMVPELCEAAKHPEIRDALVSKISRERIGIELDKMITGPFPLLSLELIHQLDLYPVVMTSPANIVRGTVSTSDTAVRAVAIVEWLCSQESQLSSTSKEEKRTLILAASVLPFLGVFVEQKNREVLGVQLVLRDAIKTNNVDINTVSTIFRGIDQLQSLANQNLNEPASRSQLGMLIRELGALWQTAIKMTTAKELLDTLSHIDLANLTSAQQVCNKYSALIQLAFDYGIADCYQWKHMVDGKRAAQVVGVKPGPVLTELLKVQMTWQLEHPQGTREECEEALVKYWQTR
ncbi:uncharacterized protein B0P05DRAFT_581543 [Gilbertella persicaria]|uniref:uncharacterized protein n=1 Tax=Gilbertella persicaria TaxID=101096 RepID=UPI00222007BC|nr:uncharacterized protein B0P05DRAFT_581543 [Gilbertella persicaria]KAI8058644.1 hypothetical protein B0P05DRAFT_581543 [Gilbertella persicaria]